MPCAMMHLQVAMLYNKDAPVEFFVGNEAPDCMDVRELKDVSHFRRYTHDREDRFKDYVRELDLSDPYILGVVLHLYTDMLWDRGPMAENKRSYSGDNWFKDYRWQIRLIGTHIYRNVSWSKEIWERMCLCDRALYDKLEAFPADKIYSYLVFNRDRDRSSEQGESPDFPHELVMSFCHQAASSFDEWLASVN